MDQTREASYAENLLYHAGFEFQPRNPGEKLNIDRLAGADVGRIVREVDIEALSSFLEEITYSELTDDDLYQYSDESLLKLFQLMQLTIEYLVDAQDTLSANLNGLAKKYAAKKREHSTLAKALAANDVLMAELKDELHYHRQFVNSSVASGGEAVTRVDPADFPSQERRPTASADPASLEEMSSGSSASASRKDDGTIRLHLVSSTHALYLQLDVQESLTVHNLQNKIAGRLLEAGNYVSFDFDKFTLFHKDEALIETSKSLRECGLTMHAALVILPRPVKEAPDTTPENSQVEPRLEELTLLATKSHEKLAQAIRTMESTKESSTAAMVEAMSTQMKSLERALREEIQRRVTDTRSGISLQQQTAPRQADVQSPLSKLNIGELVETDGGEIEEESDTKQGAPNEGTSSELEDTKMPSDDAKGELPKVDTTVGVALKVDTSAEVFDREVSPSKPPSEIEVTSDMTEDSPHEATTNGDTDESGTLSSSRSSSSMRYSASSTQLVRSVISTRTPTPTKGFLDRHIPPPEEAPATSSPYLYREAADSSKADHLHARQFRFSDASLKGLISCPDDYITSVPETAPQISQGRSASAASDLQSIEVPANVQVAGDGPDRKPSEKKKRFGFKKRPSFKLFPARMRRESTQRFRLAERRTKVRV